MEIRGARQSELEQVVELSCLAFNPDGHERYWQYVRGDNSYRLSQTRVVVINGRVISTLRVWERRIRIGASIVTMGGIGGVCTHPNYRGSGYASALMQNTIGYLRTIGCDISALFTIIPDEFYRRLGWTPFPLQGFHITRGSLKNSVNTEWMVRNFNVHTDLDAVARLYDSVNAQQSGSILRTRTYWDMQPSRIRGVLPTVVAHKSGKIGGYLNYRINENAVEISEVGIAPDEPTLLDSLVSHLLQVCEERKVLEIRAQFSQHHPFAERLITALNGRMIPTEDRAMMLYAVNLQVCLRRLLLEWEARLAAAEHAFPKLAIRFTVNKQQAVLRHHGDGTLQIFDENETQNAVELDITQKQCWQLLFGNTGRAHVKTDVSSDTSLFLSTLFPQRNVTFWPPARY